MMLILSSSMVGIKDKLEDLRRTEERKIEKD